MIVHRPEPLRPSVGEGLPPAVDALLRELGIWEQFVADGHLPIYGNISLWGSSVADESDFLLHPAGKGWRLDRPRFDDTLAEMARAAGAVWLGEPRLADCRRELDGAWRLTFVTASRRSDVRARFIVDASGRARVVARLLGVQTGAYDRLVAVVGVFAPRDDAHDHDSRTLVEAVQNGWWYAGLLRDKHLVVAYLSDADRVATARARTVQSWMALLAQTCCIGQRVARHEYQLMDTPRLICADSSRLVEACGVGWCAVGDAAAAHDPLSSGGLVAALSSGMQAAQAILRAMRNDVGSERDCNTFSMYGSWMWERYARYLAEQAAYYAQEQRWTTATFWHRRHAVLARLVQ